MAQVQQNMIRKNIQLSETLANKVSQKANRVGLPFAEYVRYVLVQDTTRHPEPVEFIPFEAEERFNRELASFLEGEKKKPTKGATNADELLAMLEDEDN